MTKRIRAQVKSRWYYIFWGTATVSVVLGQLYVGTGYRLLHNSMLELMNKVDGVLFFEERDRGGKYFQNCFNTLKKVLSSSWFADKCIRILLIQNRL